MSYITRSLGIPAQILSLLELLTDYKPHGPRANTLKLQNGAFYDDKGGIWIQACHIGNHLAPPTTYRQIVCVENRHNSCIEVYTWDTLTSFYSPPTSDEFDYERKKRCTPFTFGRIDLAFDHITALISSIPIYNTYTKEYTP